MIFTPRTAQEARRREYPNPGRWTGPLAVIFLALGIAFLSFFYQALLIHWLPDGVAATIGVPVGSMFLLGVGAGVSLSVSIVLFRWRARNNGRR